MLLLPLRHTGETIDRVLGLFSSARPAAWLGELPLATKRLIANELIWPAGAPTVDERAPCVATSPCCLPSRHARIVRSERRQFRVFEGGLGA